MERGVSPTKISSFLEHFPLLFTLNLRVPNNAWLKTKWLTKATMSQGSKDQSDQKPSLQMWVTPLFPAPHKKKKLSKNFLKLICNASIMLWEPLEPWKNIAPNFPTNRNILRVNRLCLTLLEWFCILSSNMQFVSYRWCEFLICHESVRFALHAS